MNRQEALLIMKKYGFSSKNSFPYLISLNNGFGIVYKIEDSIYGELERVSFFNSREDMEVFLYYYSWYKKNKSKKNIKVILSDYQVICPSISYMINDELVLNKEIIDNSYKVEINNYKDEASKLLDYYEHIKSLQLDFLRNYILLGEELRYKKYILEKETKSSKKNSSYSVSKHLEIKKVEDANVKKFRNKMNRISTVTEYKKLINNLWELNRRLEINKSYYDSLIDCNKKYFELEIINKKIEEINSNKKHILNIGLKKRLKEIEDNYKYTNTINEEYVNDSINIINRKYEMKKSIDDMKLYNYLKYSYGRKDLLEMVNRNKVIKNKDIMNGLSMYFNLLSQEQRVALTLYNSKFKYLFDLILQIPDFYKWSNKRIVKYLDEVEGVSRFKEEVDKLYISLNNNINKKIREEY